MGERTTLRLGIILVLAALAVWFNWDFVKRGYEHPDALLGRLTWQGEDSSTHSLKLREGLDLQGGLQLLYEAEGEITADKMNQTKSIIQNRVDALGVTEPVVQVQGEDKLVVELPGVEDPEQALKSIGKTARLEFVYSGSTPLTQGSKVESTYPQYYRELPEDKKKPHQGLPASAAKPDEAAGEGAAGEATASGSPTAEATDAEPTADAAPATEDAAAPADATSADTEGADIEGGATEEAADSSADDAAAGTPASTDAAASPAPSAVPSPTTAAQVTLYPAVVGGEHIASANAQFDPAAGGAVVAFQMATGDEQGDSRLGEFTGAHKGEYMPILLDGEVISSPSINDTISASGQISGGFTMADAEILAAQIESGALPLKLNLVSQNRIGATLGQQTVDAAIRGGLIGLLAVLLFMLLYYRLPGLLADLALVLYALFTLAIFRLLPVTLTLAGIAGFVLSVGMAVDANVLIFERVKEELRHGRRVGQALETGFSRAWTSIRDSNASTLITCLILFWFGNRFGASIVKGFAVTLALGVLTSMFTAITVTRTFLELAHRFGLFKETPGLSTAEDPALKRRFGY